MTSPRPYLVAAALVPLLFFSAARGQTTTHTSAAAITIPNSGTATPYPSVIIVSGATTSITNVTVRLNGFAHTFPSDVQVLLVAPTGQKTMLMSGVGSDIDVSGVNLVFAQDSANILPTASQLFPGTYRPRSFFGSNLPAPAPTGPYTSDLSGFNGLNANGTWSLFVNDTFTPDGGSFAGGWSITFNDTVRQPQPISTAFTYQGRLEGVPAGSTAFLRFSLWDSPDGTNTANRVGTAITRTVTLDANNLFTTSLDFGISVQRQKALFLEIAAATAAVGPFTTLAPRQPLTGVPLALQLKGVTVDTNNQVGVGGIEDPQFVFEANGRVRVRGEAGASGNSPGMWFASPNASGVQTNRGFVGMRDDTNVGLFGTDWGLLLNTTNQNIAIGDNSGIAPPERLTLTGNLQINTNPSSGRLSFGNVGDFAGTAENSDAIFFQRVNNSIGTVNVSSLRLALGDDGGTPGSVDAFVIGTVAGGSGAFTERIRFNSDGTALKPGGGSWAILSDASTKDNIAPLTGTLDRLLSLHGYAFNYKPEFVAEGRALPGPQIGLVAQDVQRVFPDWVGTSADGKLFVTERATTALMVEALRDLRAEKDAAATKAQRQINELRSQNAELLRRLEALERSIADRSNTSK